MEKDVSALGRCRERSWRRGMRLRRTLDARMMSEMKMMLRELNGIHF